MEALVRNEHGNQSLNPGQDCISHSTNILGEVSIQLFSLQLEVNQRAE